MIKLNLDRRKNQDLAQQIAEQIENAIYLNLLAKGQVLPSSKEWATMEGVAMEDVDAAYQLLAQRGALEFKSNQAVVKVFEIPQVFFDRVYSMSTVIHMSGFEPSFEDLSLTLEACPPALLKHSPLHQGSYACFNRLYKGDGVPLMHAKSYIPLVHYPEIKNNLKPQFGIWNYLNQTYHVDVYSTQLSFKAVALSIEEAKALGSNVGDIGNYVESYVQSQDHQLIEFTVIYTRARSFNFRFEFTR